MHSQLTPTAGPARHIRPINLRPAGRFLAVVAAAALAFGLLVATGTAGSTPEPVAHSADLFRWEAIAQQYSGPSHRAMDAAAARLTESASSYFSLSPARQAAADRWVGLAATYLAD